MCGPAAFKCFELLQRSSRALHCVDLCACVCFDASGLAFAGGECSSSRIRILGGVGLYNDPMSPNVELPLFMDLLV